MPCYTVQTNTVDLGKLSQGLLVAGLSREGWRVSISRWNAAIIVAEDPAGRVVRLDLGAGTLTGQGVTDADARAIKAAYGREVVRVAAVRNRWGIKQTSGVFPVVQQGVNRG